MAPLRHGGMARLFFAKGYAASTLGSFTRAFTFGHVRQLDEVASGFLTRLAAEAPLMVHGHAHGPPHTDQHPGPDFDIPATNQTSSPSRLALLGSLDTPVRMSPQRTNSDLLLTSQPATAQLRSRREL